MSTIDFSQDARDHGCLHVAVFPIGDTSGPLYAAVTEALHAMAPIVLAEPKGTVIFLRFLSPLPKWSRDGTHWESFTAYKQVLGVLTIAQCPDADDIPNIESGFRKTCERFKRTVCASRCVVYGPKERLQSSADGRKGFKLIDLDIEHDDTFCSEDVRVETLEEIVSDFALSIYITLKSRIGEFAKSYGGGGGRTDQVKLLRTPFEFKDPDEVPGEPRHFSRNHMQARVTKHLGDLYLLTGQLPQAHAHYWESLEALKSSKDWLWTGSSYEGLGTTAMVMKRCEEVLGHKVQGASIYQSSQSPVGKMFGYRLSGKAASSGSSRGNATGFTHHASIKRNSSGGVEQKQEVRLARYATVRRKSPSPDLELGVIEEGSLKGKPLDQRQDSLSNLIDVNSDEEASLRNSSSSPSLSLSLSAGLEGTSSEGAGSEGAGSEGAGSEGTEPKETDEEDSDIGFFVDKRLLQKDFIVDKYTLAIHFYTKAGAIGGLSQMEALIKFAKYLVSQRRYTLACETLQRMIAVESFVTEADKVSLYGTIAAVFSSMNFHRKAALFTHYAALQSNTLARTTQDFYNAHTLLLQCLPGYNLSLDADKQAKETAAHNGWPYLQARILKDLIFLARKLNENMAAVRHACFLLRTLYKHLSEEDLQEVTEMLEDIVEEAKEAHERDKAAVPFLKGFLCSPVPLVDFPQVRSFAPQFMAPSLTPHRHANFVPKNSSDGPFIYSALSARKKKQEEIPWVLGDPADIAMTIHNPLPFELRVQKMSILTKGAKVDAYPSSLSLPANSEPQNFILLVIPQEAGQVNILGYEATVFGVQSKCLVKIPGDPVIQVVPPLPQLRVNTFPAFKRGSDDVMGKSPDKLCLDRADDRRSSMGAKDKFELMDGETCEITFRLDCCRDVPVEQISLSMKEYKAEYCEFSWSEESINSILPLAKDEIANFYVQIQAKVPSRLRLSNDVTAGITQPSLLPVPTSAGEGGSLPSSPRRVGFEECPPSSTLPRASTPPTHSSPSSSPVAKRAKKSRAGLFVLMKQKSPQPDPVAPRNIDPFKTSPILTSLDLESSVATRLGMVTINSRQKRGYTSLQRASNTTFYVGDLETRNYDFDPYDADKRVSVCSDPGDNFFTPVGRSQLGWRQRGSDSKLSPFPKSETVGGNMSNLSNGGFNLSPTIFETADSGRTRAGSRGSLKPPYRRSPVPGLIKKGAISLPTGPLYKVAPYPPHPPARKKVVGQFVLQYTGGRGATEGYYRELSMSVTVHVKPSLIFEQFQLKPIDWSTELFQMNFNVQNISKLNLDVTCTITQEDLREHGVKTTQTLQLEAEEKKPLSVTLCRFLVPESQTLGINNESNTAKIYSEKIAEVVHFYWRSVESRQSGKVTLDGLRLPLSSISIVRPVPLLFGMSLNGCPCPMQGQHLEEIQRGASITTQVKITNNSGEVMPSSLLLLEGYQHSQEQKGVVEDLRGKMLYTGSLVARVPELQPGGTFQHAVSLMFLYKGTYQIAIKSATILLPERTSPTLRPASPSTETQQAQRQAAVTSLERDGGRQERGGADMAEPEKQKLAKTRSEALKKSAINRDKKRTSAMGFVDRENGRSHSLGFVTPETTKHKLAAARDLADRQPVPPVASSNRNRTVCVTPLAENKDGSSSSKICLSKRVSDSSSAGDPADAFSHGWPQLGHFKLSRPVCGPHITFHVA